MVGLFGIPVFWWLEAFLVEAAQSPTANVGVTSRTSPSKDLLADFQKTIAGLRSAGGNYTALAGKRQFLPEEEGESRIIGGQEAWPHSWPWQVLLSYNDEPACGGAILNPSWVISASHCFLRFNNPLSWKVMAGKHDLGVSEACEQFVQVSDIIIHPQYSPKAKRHDVALLKLQTPLNFDVCVRPILVETQALAPSQMCSVTGWGSTRENGPKAVRLQEVNVTIFRNDACNNFYPGLITANMVCAGEEVGGIDACQGDSGGPLSCLTETGYKLAGLVSWGVGCGRARKPGVYTKVFSYTEWISNVVAEDSGFRSAPGMSEAAPTCGSGVMPPCGLDAAFAVVKMLKTGASVQNVMVACPGSWPWQVSLQAKGKHYCSGTLIHHQWVLTPRHCKCSTNDTVVLGAHYLWTRPSNTILVEEVYSPVHDDFPFDHDLSLIRLRTPAPSGTTVLPVCVPGAEMELDNSWACVTTGWKTRNTGSDVEPEILNQARLTLFNETACKVGWGDDLISDTHLCAGSAGSTSCMGDSGAPLLCQKHDIYYLFGMMTWGSRTCDNRRPAVYTKVSSYWPWIHKVMEDV